MLLLCLQVSILKSLSTTGGPSYSPGFSLLTKVGDQVLGRRDILSKKKRGLSAAAIVGSRGRDRGGVAV